MACVAPAYRKSPCNPPSPSSLSGALDQEVEFALGSRPPRRGARLLDGLDDICGQTVEQMLVKTAPRASLDARALDSPPAHHLDGSSLVSQKLHPAA